MIDTRAEAGRILRGLEFHSGWGLLKFLACCVVAVTAAAWPEHSGLSDAGRWSLGIVLLGAGLWITEAIPAFAVALLIIGLQIITLGQPGGVMLAADDSQGWEMFVKPWASPPMWLFFGGLVLARAAERTGMDRHLAVRVLRWSCGRATRLLPALMAMAFVFSMFMSNTATTALMLVMLRPALAGLPEGSKSARALLLGLAAAANLGGMATIIGTPPNVIAAGLLEQVDPVSFMRWSAMALPPALLLAGICWLMLMPALLRESAVLPCDLPPAGTQATARISRWQRIATLLILLLTIGLWMTGSWHGIPSGVVSFVPIVGLSMISVIGKDEIKSIEWDVLILLAGGLSLGVGIEASGLAQWLAGMVQERALPAWLAALLLAWLGALVSNLMSNTAAANILLPVTLVIARAAAGTSAGVAEFVLPVALGCSAAMVLPISTPPNALVFASGRLRTLDYLPVGAVMFLTGPPLILAWCWLTQS